MRLPSMVYADGIRAHTQVKFGGYNHTAAAHDGEIYDMANMTGDQYPILASRPPRKRVRSFTKPNGLYARDGLWRVDGTVLYKDEETIYTGLSDGRKQFVTLGVYVIVHPDMVYVNTLTGEVGTLSATWTGTVKFSDGTYAGEEAKANTVTGLDGVDFSTVFREGDAVTISGCSNSENNKTPIIREMDGKVLRFYENTFTIGTGGDTETVTIKRSIPEMDFLCENENRLWGCKGDTVYASKLGDPFNWNVFDGVATDSFTVDVGSAGDFTGCVSYKGYPCFFKEEHVYKMYGSIPSNFQLMASASLGVEEGSGASFAVAGEVLFYLSRAGVVAYSGGIPVSVSAPFGEERYKNAVAGSDGVKVYISMQDADGVRFLFVYDTRRNLWYKEDASEAIGFAWHDGMLLMLTVDGSLWEIGAADGAETVESMVEFGDFTESDPNKKGLTRLRLRLEADKGASVTVQVQFDSDGVWRDVRTLTSTVKKSFTLPIVPRRCDHFRIRILSVGQWRLHSMVRESYSGSEY